MPGQIARGSMADPPPQRRPANTPSVPSRALTHGVTATFGRRSTPVAGQARCVLRSLAAVGLPERLSEFWCASERAPLTIEKLNSRRTAITCSR